MCGVFCCMWDGGLEVAVSCVCHVKFISNWSRGKVRTFIDSQLQCCMQACACLCVCPCKDVRSLPAASLASKSSENKVPAKTVTWSNPTASRAGAMIHVCVDVCAYEVEREGNKVFMSVLDIKYICIVLIIDVLAIWFCFVWYLTVCVYFGAVSRF